MTTPPWERRWLQTTPEDFERIVVAFLRDLPNQLAEFEVTHQERLSGPDGEFVLDAVAKFEALGAEFVVAIECKHHKNPIKREYVQVLRDKVRSLPVDRGMLFSTAPFQRGAIEYAAQQRIVLVHFTSGGPIYETRDETPSVGPCRPYDAYWVHLSEDGNTVYSFGAGKDLWITLLHQSGEQR